MIDKLQIFCSTSLDPYYNIATEKLLLDTVKPGCCILYLWQNENTVVIGRNQNAWAECRTTLLEQEGGKLARRLSGGGAVFHDIGNLNFTFVMPEADYDLDKQLSVIQQACKMVGITVARSGRNDLLAEGCKFSGNAFYHSQGNAYHHGTLLVKADMDKLSRYLTPSKAKLQAKGVSSVRSRVINLQSLVPSLTCDILADCMQAAFGQVYGFTPEKLGLSPADIQSIEEYATELKSWQWLYGTRLPFTFSCEARFDWGSILLQLQVNAGIIETAQVYSDAMEWDLPTIIEQALIGCRFSLSDMTDALNNALSDTQKCRNICQMLENQNI